jgi:hypothetical protein
MAPLRPTLLAAPFQGRWRMARMDRCDGDALDRVAPAFLEITGPNGAMRFVCERW